MSWRHTFPGRISRPRMLRASRNYRCQCHATPRRPADHVEVIQEGERYVRVALRPPEEAPGRWTSIRLCIPCARSFHLLSSGVAGLEADS